VDTSIAAVHSQLGPNGIRSLAAKPHEMQRAPCSSGRRFCPWLCHSRTASWGDNLPAATLLVRASRVGPKIRVGSIMQHSTSLCLALSRLASLCLASPRWIRGAPTAMPYAFIIAMSSRPPSMVEFPESRLLLLTSCSRSKSRDLPSTRRDAQQCGATVRAFLGPTEGKSPQESRRT
jgi:hypothetical protein